MKKAVFITTVIMFLCTTLFAKEKKERCGGTYTYTYSTAISYDVAKSQAIEYAIVNAISEKFGTLVSSQSMQEITTKGERFNQMSRLLVKGRFLSHIKKPWLSKPVFADNVFTMQVTVDFYAQPIDYAPTDFSVKMLRNGIDDKFESSEFKANDSFFMSFTSPKNGYVAVFFEDTDTVSCMLPYYENDNTPLAVEKGRRYIFFNTTNNEYYFSCGEEPEINYIHVLFSPHSFIHGDLVREMTNKKFNDWLLKRQAYDEELQMMTLMVRVSPF